MRKVVFFLEEFFFSGIFRNFFLGDLRSRVENSEIASIAIESFCTNASSLCSRNPTVWRYHLLVIVLFTFSDVWSRKKKLKKNEILVVIEPILDKIFSIFSSIDHSHNFKYQSIFMYWTYEMKCAKKIIRMNLNRNR